MTEDAKGAGRIAEAACDFCRGEFIDEIRAEGFLLVLPWGFGSQEEAGSLRMR